MANAGARLLEFLKKPLLPLTHDITRDRMINLDIAMMVMFTIGKSERDDWSRCTFIGIFFTTFNIINVLSCKGNLAGAFPSSSFLFSSLFFRSPLSVAS